MSRFMMTLANAVANHVKEGKISIYKNSNVEYSLVKFQECLSRCSGVKFYDFERKDFDTFMTLEFLKDVSYNGDKSFEDMVYVITVIANNHEE